jgi:putative copper resistance protein D
VATTQFGGVWLWQIILAAMTVGRMARAAERARLLLLAMGQLILLAG